MVLDELLTFVYFGNLVQDPSRMVREGLRSILNPQKYKLAHRFKQNIEYWYCLLLPMIAYRLLPPCKVDKALLVLADK